MQSAILHLFYFTLLLMCVHQGEQKKLSVTLKFQSLCQFFSTVDPSGLLGLPASISASSTQVYGLDLYYSLFVIFIKFTVLCLQCFDAVGWAAGRASGL